MTRRLVWRRLDAPCMEIAHVESLDSAAGTQIGAVGSSKARYSSGTFTAEIAFDDDGFVTTYEGFLERVAA